MAGSKDNSMTDDEVPPIMSEQIGFALDELVACAKCSKPNAPDRHTSLHCGRSLPVTERNADSGTMTLRRLEAWEPGINIMLQNSDASVSNDAIDAASRLLAIDATEFASTIESRTTLPVARVEGRRTNSRKSCHAVAKFENRNAFDRRPNPRCRTSTNSC